jgi:predicted nicotinamide N-methyase
VTAVDVDPLARTATVLAAEANGVAIDVRAGDLVGDPLSEVEVVLAGDVWYERGPAARFQRWFTRLAARGTKVLTSDPGRGHPPRGVRELASYEVPTPFDLEAAPSRTTRVLAIEPPPPRPAGRSRGAS